MDYSIKSGDPITHRTACLVVAVFSPRKLGAVGQAIDAASNGHLTQILKSGDMEGKLRQRVMLYQVPGITANRVLLVGCGPQKEFTPALLRDTVSAAVKLLDEGPMLDGTLCLSDFQTDADEPFLMAKETVVAAESAVYRFDALKTQAEAPKRPLKKLTLWLSDRGQTNPTKRAARQGQAIGNAVKLTSDLANLPGNLCTPTYLADQAKQLGKRFSKLRVKVLEESQMEKLGMGALLSVSRGSRQPAKLITMEYQGGKPKSKPVVLVGKGLTFDAGGISLKPAEAMDEMKYDMCGGASVLGAISACAELELPLNLVGLVPASENLPDGDANKPGDIVTSMSGQTIEILNTDAEGRLILCDTLTYSKRYNPAAVIDMATLTGACIVALGKHASGLLSNDDDLAEKLLDAGARSGDRAWRLPLWEDYQKQLDSNFADMANIGGKQAGAITAACFLARFTKDFKWAHLDIAGSAWNSGKEKGATGRPVPLLVEYLLERCGKSGK